MSKENNITNILDRTTVAINTMPENPLMAAHWAIERFCMETDEPEPEELLRLEEFAKHILIFCERNFEELGCFNMYDNDED